MQPDKVTNIEETGQKDIKLVLKHRNVNGIFYIEFDQCKTLSASIIIQQERKKKD